MIFELVVFDTKKQAEEFTPIITDTHVQRAISVGESLCGLRYRQYRPNKLTRKHRPLTTEQELCWESDCLFAALDMRGVPND